MTIRTLGFQLAVAGFASGAVLAPAMSAPISFFPKDLAKAVSANDSEIEQVAARGGSSRGGAARGGAVRGGAVRGGAAYRGGTVVRGGTAVRTGGVAVSGPAAYGYSTGYCDPNYQN